MKRSIFGLACASMCSTAALMATSAPAYAQQAQARREFNIPAQPLASALIEFSRQSGTVVTAPAQLTRQKAAPALRGDYTPPEALRALLAGSGLRFRSSAGGSFIIERGAQLSASNPSAVEAASTPGDDQDSNSANNEIIVTGTTLRQQRLSAPTTVVTAQQIERTGYSSVADVIRSLPQNFAGGFNDVQTYIAPTTDSADNVGYASAPNLRGLGAGATLTLLNGRRAAPSGVSNAVDLSAIPLAAIDRIDVVADGSSAIYGSDAVAGVVNIVLKDRLQGGQTTAQYGFSDRGDATSARLSQTAGVNWSTGGGVIAFEHFEQKPLLASDRSFSANVPSPSFLSPQRNRESYFGHFTQSIGPRVTLFADGLYSDLRVFSQNSALPFLETDQHYKTNSLTAIAGLRADLFSDWRLNIAGTYGRVRQSEETTYRSFNFTNNSHLQNSVRSINGQLDGALFNLPGGAARLALGLDYRTEKLTEDLYGSPVTFDRSIFASYAEVRLPLTPETASVGRIDLDGALRYEHYSDFGGIINPRVGLSWRPTRSVTLRSTWSSSYQAPTLFQLYAPISAGVQPAADPTSPTGSITALAYVGGNPNLRAQKSTTFTAGIDWQPDFATGLRLSLTGFRINFRNRIQTLESDFNQFLVNEQFDQVGIIRNPTIDQINSVISTATFYTPGTPLSQVQVILNGTKINVARSNVSGLDFDANYSHPLANGTINLGASATYFLNYDRNATPTAPSLTQVNRLFQPARFRARALAGWSQGRFELTTNVNYVNSYENTTVAPAESVGSFLTVDTQLAYRLVSSCAGCLVKGGRISLSVRNLFDRNPPFVRSPSFAGGAPFGYDPANADPFGRMITVQASLDW